MKEAKLEEALAENFGQEEVDSDEEHRAQKIAKQRELTVL